MADAAALKNYILRVTVPSFIAIDHAITRSCQSEDKKDCQMSG